MVVSLWALAARADCPERVPVERISELLDEAEHSFAELDIATFIARSDAVRASVPCLGGVPSQELVARLHRTEGLRLFGERNVDSVRAFAAARSLDPDYVFPSELIPPGSPIRSDYSAMDLSTGASTELPEPVSGALHVDGLATRERSLAWPALVQLVPAEAELPLWSSYLTHGQPPPAYEAVPPPPPDPVPDPILPPQPVPVPLRRSPRVPLLVATGATALVAGVTYGAAWSRYSIWDKDETPYERLDPLRAQTNTLGGIALASGLVTVGLGAVTVITW